MSTLQDCGKQPGVMSSQHDVERRVCTKSSYILRTSLNASRWHCKKMQKVTSKSLNIWATDEITCLGKCHHQMWGVPYRLSGFWMFGTSTSKQKHAIYINLHCGMIWFATWSSKPRCASSFWQQMQITIKFSNAPSFILVTLPIGTYPVGETMKLERKGG